MQHMPDKDFDKLFKDSFMDAEVEPSADLWGNIAEQLEPKKKRSFPLMWMAAASVVVVASVMLFTKSSDKIYLQGAAPEVAAVTSTHTLPTATVANSVETTKVSSTVLSDAGVSNRRLVRKTLAKGAVAKIEVSQEKSFAAVQPSEKNEHLPIKRSEVKPLDVTPVEEKVDRNNDARMIVLADNTKKVATDNGDMIEESSESKKGIRNMGDLINYVVDKVDKRDQKLIKFNTDDDDNSSIIGLNIGFLKLNKKNK
ncbi:hypothetical protein D3C87_153230 [compost metagenome]